MRRFLILATAVLAGGLLPACGDDTTEPESILGLYNLVTVNGEALPTDAGGFEIIAASIELKSDGTYTISLTFDLGGGPETDIQTGEFTVDPLEFDDFTGTVSGNTLTLVSTTVPPVTFVWRK